MSWVFQRRRFKRRPAGGYGLRLAPSERALLGSLPGQLEGLLGMPEPPPNLERLFPPAYPDDPAAERGYRDLMHRELLEHHRGAFRALAESVDAESLTDDQAAGWMTALNDVRLILGTTLSVTDDWQPDLEDPTTRDVSVLYLFLAELQSELIDEMSAGLPDPQEEDEEFLADPWGDPPAGMRWAPPGAPPVADATLAPLYRGPERESPPPPDLDVEDQE